MQSKLFTVLENMELENIDDVPMNSPEGELAQIELTVQEDGVSELNDSVEAGTEAIVSLEALVATLEGLTTIDPTHAALAHQVMTGAMRSIGATAQQAKKVVPAIESITSKQVVIESVGEKIKSIAAGVVETAKRWWAKLMEFLTGLFNNVKALKKRHLRLTETVKKVGYFKQDATTNKAASVNLILSKPHIKSGLTVMSKLLDFTKQNTPVVAQMLTTTSLKEGTPEADKLMASYKTMVTNFLGLLGKPDQDGICTKVTDEMFGGWFMKLTMNSKAAEMMTTASNPSDDALRKMSHLLIKDLASFKCETKYAETKDAEATLFDGNDCKEVLHELESYFKLLDQGDAMVKTAKDKLNILKWISRLDATPEGEALNITNVYHMLRNASTEPLLTVINMLYKAIAVSLSTVETSISKGVALKDLPAGFAGDKPSNNAGLLTA